MNRMGGFVGFHGGESSPPPHPRPEPPDFAVPNGACDTHAHVFADPDRFPLNADRNYTPAIVGEHEYLDMLGRLRMDRGVLVQPSVYGTDNSLLLSVLAAHPDRLRGIVVIREDATTAEIAAMHKLGVRGIRLNLIYRGGVTLHALSQLARRVIDYGWHLQLLIDGDTLPEIVDTLKKTGLPLVFDHMAQMPLYDGVETDACRALYALMESGSASVKLSGANRFASQGIPREAISAWRRRLATVAPHACLWGSDWPHVGVPIQINTGSLLNDFASDLLEDDLRRLIMSDNASQLYDF